MLTWLADLDLPALFLLALVLIGAAGVLGSALGRRQHGRGKDAPDLGTLAGAALGLVGLLLAFSFSIALNRFDARRLQVLEEANAIGSTANFALMLPQAAQQPILDLLREYTEVRVGLGVPYDPDKLQRDIARSLELQGKLWQQAVAVTAAAPQSLPAYRFVASLNEMNNVHERRLTALRYHVPLAVMFVLIGVAMVAMGFTGYFAGAAGSRRTLGTLIMSATVAVLIVLIVDIDRPERGVIKVPDRALVYALDGIKAIQASASQ